MNPVKYIQETLGELKLVHWPTRETTVKLSIMVIAVSAVVALYVGGLDYTFTNLLKLILK
ncbi:MAG: Preprotein translocase, SecE subunit [Candidatus Amesbacteria bacterium GW2011_GWA2_42_12]|uniref:Protein translocase subunit SecE n=1 Tax=Candidatus Amesbacteria bacterium GW2011_GWA2_42_12 TaxID=1618356 RepID=A0A0G0Y6B6_9BACT|nr:MAG: Preprotein translocase, SecE subunit [Candidatus Amesbacteria bacterium GW2011_GWA2_42_12]